MSDILNKNFVLKLNKYWRPIEVTNVYEAIIAMCREPTAQNGFSRPYFGVDIDYPTVNYPPLEWKDWVNLPVRPQDNYIQSAKKQIRVPTVIVANNFKDVPEKEPKFSKRAVKRRDGYRCQYSGEIITDETGDLDHLMPLSRGGKTTFENLASALKKINRLKGNMTVDEFLKKYPQYKRPRPFRPKKEKIRIENTYGIQDWDLFLKK